MKRAQKKPPRFNLYWVTTSDHDEDWFIVAPDAPSATKFHEEAEGYDEGEASAELVCEVPDETLEVEAGWPSEELIAACGGVLLPSPDGPRIVKIAGKIYMEGDIIGNVAARKGFLFKN